MARPLHATTPACTNSPVRAFTAIALSISRESHWKASSGVAARKQTTRSQDFVRPKR